MHDADEDRTPDTPDETTTELDQPEVTTDAVDDGPEMATAHPVNATEPERDAATSAAADEERFHTRSLAYGAIGVAALALAFFAGMAVRGHDGDGPRGMRFDQARGQMQQGGPGGMQGGPGGMPGGRDGMRGGRGGHGEYGGGERHGMHGDQDGRGGRGMMGGRFGGGGGMGEVTKVSDNELTIDREHSDGSLTVKLTDDTKVLVHGDGGPRDAEEGTVSDIEKGDHVMVRGSSSDDTITAEMVFVMHSGDE
ncbi:MAG: hypothetical protein KDC46_03030 [Thermoleophilia bacterium]|nr:hypothetical protein [Thermoleophilia bacterium]